MSETNPVSPMGKQPLKRVELHVNKFNDVAIPHHVDLLRKHKSNIEKFQALGDWEKVHREQINATRLVKQLKALIYEMDMLRSQVQDVDLRKFDKLTADARATALDAIKEYLAMNPERRSPVWVPPQRPDIAKDNLGVTLCENGDDVAVSQMKLVLNKEDVQKQEACLKSWETLRTEIEDIHDLFQEFAQVVHDQKESVDEIETDVETAAENVLEGASHLRRAARLKTAVYPLAGALLGGCLGGPIGIVAGAKLGGLVALGCGVLGFTGGRILKKKHEQQEYQEIEMTNMDQQRNLKGSLSLPALKDDVIIESSKLKGQET